MDREPALFRQEALDFQREHRQWGNVALLEPLPLKASVWLLVLGVFLLVVFLFKADYTRKETAIGYLTPGKGTAKVFAPRRGTIKELHVTEGQSVQAGQSLITIETDQISADGLDVNKTQLDILASQRELLSRNIEAETQRAAPERDRLSALAAGLQAEISQLRGQIHLQDERLSVAERDLASADQLRTKGFMAPIEFRKRQAATLEQQQVQSSLHQQLAAKENQLIETRAALEQLPTTMAQKVQLLRTELAATEQRIADFKGRGAYVIRAARDGVVSTLQASVGQNVDPTRLQLEIVPHDHTLRAELFVPARAIGFVQVGQPVRILYDAFPYQQFGSYRGQIVTVSQTILTATDAAGPLKLNEPAYRITATIEKAEIDAYGKRLPLQPDMLLKADILLESRSLMTWLLSPLLGVRM